MVYDWEGKRDICLRLYIDEKRPLEEIMQYMKINYNFAPSKRAYQTQFRRWDFPSKQNPAHRNLELVACIKELWERNTNQKEMLRILNDIHGFQIKERELMRVRARHRWLLRVPNGSKAKDRSTDEHSDGGMTDGVAGDGTGREIEASTVDGRTAAVAAKRAERREKLHTESNLRWETRKRRRRTRGWAGLPADPPGPPRFPSETTIEESKIYLQLDTKTYNDLRNCFTAICNDYKVSKKTEAGNDKWERLKMQLIQQSDHLQEVFWAQSVNIDQKKLALDVICTDVTKRMRTVDRRMTIAEAKNILGINPEESRQVRDEFYQLLKSDHFTSKLEAGPEHWAELKQKWIADSQLLTKVLEGKESDAKHDLLVRALEVVCRDVMKRLRDDQSKRDPAKKRRRPSPRSIDHDMAEMGADMAADVAADFSGVSADVMPQFNSTAPSDLTAFHVSPHDPLVSSHGADLTGVQVHQAPNHGAHAGGQLLADHPGLQIDPTLLLPGGHTSLMSQGPHGHQFASSQYADQQFAQAAAAAAANFESPPPPPPNPIVAYFRLLPSSTVEPHTRLWMNTMAVQTVAEIKAIAAEKYPAAHVDLIQGIVKQPPDSELAIAIDHDDEVGAYVSALSQGKPTFALVITAWKPDS